MRAEHLDKLVEDELVNPTSPNKPALSDQPLKPTVKPPRKRRRWLIVVGTLVAAVLLFFGIPLVIRAFNTVSTDDAYVNGYVTFVAPRVSGQVTRVLVDDDNRVKKGDVLVELDPKPHQVEVAIKQAAVDTAKANLVLAQANARGLIGQARSNRFKLARAIEDVDNQVALIRARVANELGRCAGRSRRDVLLGSPGAGRFAPKRRTARRFTIVLQSDTQANVGGVPPARSYRQRRSNLC